MNREKVTTEKLRSMRVGELRAFNVPTVRDIRSAQTLAYRLYRFEPERGIRFRTICDYDNCRITILAEEVTSKKK